MPIEIHLQCLISPIIELETSDSEDEFEHSDDSPPQMTERPQGLRYVPKLLERVTSQRFTDRFPKRGGKDRLRFLRVYTILQAHRDSHHEALGPV